MHSGIRAMRARSAVLPSVHVAHNKDRIPSRADGGLFGQSKSCACKPEARGCQPACFLRRGRGGCARQQSWPRIQPTLLPAVRTSFASILVFAMESSTAQFTELYQALDPTRSIRLVQIGIDATDDEPMCCELRIVSLDDRPEYVAVSCVWRDPNITTDIIANGSVLPVTTNLAGALRRMRTKDRTQSRHWLWIDAICIHQEKVREKIAQVAIVSGIY